MGKCESHLASMIRARINRFLSSQANDSIVMPNAGVVHFSAQLNGSVIAIVRWHLKRRRVAIKMRSIN